MSVVCCNVSGVSCLCCPSAVLSVRAQLTASGIGAQDRIIPEFRPVMKPLGRFELSLERGWMEENRERGRGRERERERGQDWSPYCIRFTSTSTSLPTGPDGDYCGGISTHCTKGHGEYANIHTHTDTQTHTHTFTHTDTTTVSNQPFSFYGICSQLLL